MSEIVVANVKDDVAGEYIGRAIRGRVGSVLGNPFRISKESARAEAIKSYEFWLRHQMGLPNSVQLAEIERLERILASEGRLVLLCWCAPAACHGDVVAKIIREREA